MEKKFSCFIGKMEPIGWGILPFIISILGVNGLIDLIVNDGPIGGCLIMGVIAVGGIVIGIRMLYGRMQIRDLKKNGLLVQGTITELYRMKTVKTDHGYKNSRDYTVKCTYENPYTGIRYEGENGNYSYWYEDMLEIGQSVDVYVDRIHSEKCYVDIIGTIEKQNR